MCRHFHGPKRRIQFSRPQTTRRATQLDRPLPESARRRLTLSILHHPASHRILSPPSSAQSAPLGHHAFHHPFRQLVRHYLLRANEIKIRDGPTRPLLSTRPSQLGTLDSASLCWFHHSSDCSHR